MYYYVIAKISYFHGVKSWAHWYSVIGKSLGKPKRRWKEYYTPLEPINFDEINHSFQLKLANKYLSTLYLILLIVIVDDLSKRTSVMRTWEMQLSNLIRNTNFHQNSIQSKSVLKPSKIIKRVNTDKEQLWTEWFLLEHWLLAPKHNCRTW